MQRSTFIIMVNQAVIDANINIFWTYIIFNHFLLEHILELLLNIFYSQLSGLSWQTEICRILDLRPGSLSVSPTNPQLFQQPVVGLGLQMFMGPIGK